jgi:hypothetical protein
MQADPPVVDLLKVEPAPESFGLSQALRGRH